LTQLWVFIIAPWSGALSAVGYLALYPAGEQKADVEPAQELQA